ncbi:hypothetical protein FJT64_001805 [Amphibalanus amphitrite]|uniref:Uncharacterized protein n=1 Tax=Amphibalanus amphitrite TaxID=1232801 RepID=A0A6A4X3L4_AMPAM|nr:hypothetical protein FJT64_001805 [Amphibalanus amphitrite]
MLKPSVNRWPTAIFFFIMGVAQVNASTIILLNRGRPNDVKKGARRSIIYAMGQQLVRPRLLERAARPVGLNSSALTALACVAREAALSEDSSGSGGVPSGSGGVPSGSGGVHSGSGGVPSGSGSVHSTVACRAAPAACTVACRAAPAACTVACRAAPAACTVATAAAIQLPREAISRRRHHEDAVRYAWMR